MNVARKHAHVDDTLTRAEREAPFRLADAGDDDEPLPRPTRLAVEWDGPCWAEIDPESGKTLTVGEVGWAPGAVPQCRRRLARAAARSQRMKPQSGQLTRGNRK